MCVSNVLIIILFAGCLGASANCSGGVCCVECTATCPDQQAECFSTCFGRPCGDAGDCDGLGRETARGVASAACERVKEDDCGIIFPYKSTEPSRGAPPVAKTGACCNTVLDACLAQAPEITCRVPRGRYGSCGPTVLKEKYRAKVDELCKKFICRDQNCIGSLASQERCRI